jgi:uncharacterized protein DUF6972
MGSAKPAMPQSWNRYSYCINNPVVLVDPSGLIWGYQYDDKSQITTFQWFNGNNVGEGFTKVTNFYVEGTIDGRKVGLHLNPDGPNSFILSAWRALSPAAYFSIRPGDYYTQGYEITRTKEDEAFLSKSGGVDMMPNQPFDVGLAFAGGLGSFETGTVEGGLSMAGKAFELKFLARHLPGTRAAARQIASDGKAFLFNDLSTMSRVESEIFARGTYTGSRDGFARFGLQFSEPIGYRLTQEGTTSVLDYGELKLRENGLYYHVVPRTGPSKVEP